MLIETEHTERRSRPSTEVLRAARAHVGWKLGTLARHTARRMGAEDGKAAERIRVRLHEYDRGRQRTLPRDLHEAVVDTLLAHLRAWPDDARGQAVAHALREDGDLAPLRARDDRLRAAVRVGEEAVARLEADLDAARAELVDTRRLASEAAAELAWRERKSTTKR